VEVHWIMGAQIAGFFLLAIESGYLATRLRRCYPPVGECDDVSLQLLNNVPIW